MSVTSFTQTKYVNRYGRIFDYELSAQQDEERTDRHLQLRSPEDEADQLIVDIQRARIGASDPMLIHTMTQQGFMLMSVRGVCERFAAKHKDLRMA